MGLSALNFTRASDAGQFVHLISPIAIASEKIKKGDKLFLEGNKDKPIRIRIIGKEGARFEAIMLAESEELKEIVAAGKTLSEADKLLRQRDLFVKCTDGWENLPTGWIEGTDDDTPVAYSQENAAKLYGQPGMYWIREQLDAYVDERQHFLSEPAKS